MKAQRGRWFLLDAKLICKTTLGVCGNGHLINDSGPQAWEVQGLSVRPEEFTHHFHTSLFSCKDLIQRLKIPSENME